MGSLLDAGSKDRSVEKDGPWPDASCGSPLFSFRVQARAPFLPLIESIGTTPSLKSLSDTCTERIASNLPVWPKPSKKGLKIVPRLHFQLDIDHSDVEGRYLVPQGLLSFDKVQAQSRDRVSPGNGECPKIFQKVSGAADHDHSLDFSTDVYCSSFYCSSFRLTKRPTFRTAER
jgi:hypothetical protein